MSMRDYPCCGYVISEAVAKIIINKYAKEHLDDFETHLQEGNLEQANELLRKISLDFEIPAPDFAFILSDEDSPGDELEVGIVYFSYHKESLYTCNETSQLTKLFREVGLSPVHAAWSTVG